MPEGGGIKPTTDSTAVATEAVQGQVDTAQAFISYASADRAIAEAVCSALEREGVRCWIAPRDVTPGELYAANIVHALDAARVVVLVLSQHAADSAHVHREVERAASKRHPILSFRIDQAPLPNGLEYFLNSSQWLDASATGIDRAFPRLVEAVKGALGKTTLAAPVNKSPFAAAKTGTQRNRMLMTAAVLIAAALAFVGVDRLWLSKHDDSQGALVGATTASPESSAALAVPAMSAVSAKTIAVLPFVNMSSDKEQEYFSDGLSEELLNLLAKVPELRVAARTSSFYYKGKDVKLTDVARELQVAHLLEGSVRKSGTRVRITAQLIRASDGFHQWSETYDRTLEDVLAVQDEIAKAVVSQLKITLLSAPEVRKTNPEAYALYLQALQLDRQGTDRFEEGIALCQKVLAIDPSYPPAWLLLGANYANQANTGLRPLAEGMEKARETFHKALAIDPQYGLAHAGLGWLAMGYDHDLAAAARHLERAMALNPTDPDILGAASALNEALGRLETSVPLVEYLVSRDPMNPLLHSFLGNAYLNEGRLDESIASSRAAVKLSPAMIHVHGLIGDALFLKGDYKAALTEYKNEPIEAARLAGLSMTHYEMANKSESDAALDELIEKHGDWANLIAVVYVYRDEFDRAFEWLHKAVALRDASLAIAPTSVWLRRLHEDRRWLPFLRKIGKAPEQLAAIKFEFRVPEH